MNNSYSKMKPLLSILTFCFIVVGQCRDINHATRGKGPMPDESVRREVCIDEHLGCFPETEPNSAPSRSDRIADWFSDKFWRSSRDRVGTEFRFWAPGSKSAEIITNQNLHVHITKNSGYDPSLKAIFIIHGFHGGDAKWAVTMKDALMRKEPSNIFIVDWSGGDGLLYGTARENTWIVGAEVGRFIERVGIKTGLKLNKVHIIGHSLGAHASGFAGKWIKNRLGSMVARITGLDPAGPDFVEVVSSERLDMQDAEFVDIIHTNWAENLLEGLGLLKPIGHFDFYPNGGEDQPGCPTAGEASEHIALETLEIINPIYLAAVKLAGDNDDIGDAVEELSCSHGRAIQFFIESISSDSCQFLADECASLSLSSAWSDYTAGKCPPEGNLRVPMGYNAVKFKEYIDRNVHKRFYLRTQASSPFCIE